MDNKEDLKKIYWDGNFNKACRFWFYINRGMDMVNQFRNLFLLIIGLYFVLKLHNPIFLILMFSVSLIILLIAGWLQVHKIGKVLDYLSTKYSTHWSLYGFTLQEQIRDGIQELVKRSEKISH